MSAEAACTVPGCVEPSIGCCDCCDQPRCLEHGASSSYDANGHGDTFQCQHDDASPWTASACYLLAVAKVAP